MGSWVSSVFLKLKLRQKIWYFFMILLVCYFIGIGGIFCFIIGRQNDEYTEENNRNTLMAISNNFASEIEKVNNFSRLLLTNEEMIQYLCADEDKLFEAYAKGVEYIYKVQPAFPTVASIYAFRRDGEYFMVGSGVTRVDRAVLESDDWVQPIHSRKGGYLLQINGNGVFKTKEDRNVISLIRDMNDIHSMKKIGILAVNIPISVLEDTYHGSSGGTSHFAYADSNKNILCADCDSEEFAHVEIGDEPLGQKIERKLFHKKIYSYLKIPETDIVLLCVEKVNVMDNISGNYILILLSFSLLTIFAFFVMQAFISNFITTPIQKMVGAMSLVKDGWLKRVSVKTGEDEIGQLKDSYNQMLLELNTLINQIVEKERLIRKSEVEIIQQQIKPHFLYNTIETIACMALEGESKEVYNALETLGGFYRQFLSKGNDVVKLSVEVEIICNYMEIQRMRYGDIFTMEFESEEEYTDVMVPKLILQPIVENSLYHGIRPKGEQGIIRIKIWEDKQYVYIQIYDTGIGMSKEQLKHVMEEESKSFGLKRTIERIQYYENREDVYEITSEEGLYTSIVINIDKHKEKRESDKEALHV